jgi:Ni,Fe-hydrogenase III large subunit
MIFLLNIQVKTYEDIIEDMLVRLDEFCQTADMVSKIIDRVN